MHIEAITNKPDKNGNDMKVVKVNGQTVYVNSKYDEAIYNIITPESDIEIAKDKSDFWKIKPESLGIAKSAMAGAYKAMKKPNIGEAMAVKAENIRTAQNAKEESIALAGSASDATAITTAMINSGMLKPLDDKAIEVEWIKWRTFFKGHRQIPF